MIKCILIEKSRGAIHLIPPPFWDELQRLFRYNTYGLVLEVFYRFESGSGIRCSILVCLGALQKILSMKKFISYGKFFLGWPLSILALIFIFKFIDTRLSSINSFIHTINYLLLLYGMISYVLFYALRSFLWREILKTKGHSIPLKTSTFMWAYAEIKRFVPGVIWSVLGRTMLFSKEKIKPSTVLSGMTLEIQTVILSTMFLSFLSVPFVLTNFSPVSYYANLSIGLLLGFIAFSYAYFFHSKLTEKIHRPKNSKRAQKIWEIHDALFSSISLKIKVRLFLIGIITFSFFGLGTYLVVAASVALNPYDIVSTIGFFILSYFIGYVSIIVPLGLGVREGAIILGLSSTMPVATAAFVAISARVIFVIAELFFLLFAYLWKNAKGKWYVKLETFLKKNKPLIVTILLILMYVSYFTPVSFLRYDNFYTGRFDLGNMDQTVWNTYRGRIFQLTDPDGTQIMSRLGFHADFILILLSPFYHIWADPRMLLIIQTVTLACGGLFVFLIAKNVLKKPSFALIFAFAYLLSPSVQHTNMYDFHAVTLATTFLLGAYYFLSKHKYYLFSLFLILAGLCKEQIWVIAALFGLYIAFHHEIKINNIRRKLIGIGLFILGIGIFYLLIAQVIPAFRGSNHFALSYYSDFGDSPLSIAKNMILSPGKTFSYITQDGRAFYLLQLSLPLGFLMLAAPEFLLFAVPDLAINLLSNNRQLHQIYFQYTATITPFLFIAAIYGARRIEKRIPRLTPYLGWYLLITTIIGAYLYGPLPPAQYANIDMMHKPLAYKEEINSFISQIKKKYSIAATNNIGSHLSRRQRIYTIPVGVNTSDVVIFLLNDPYAQPSREAQIKMAESLRQDPRYVVAFEKEEFIAFRKKDISF